VLGPRVERSVPVHLWLAGRSLSKRSAEPRIAATPEGLVLVWLTSAVEGHVALANDRVDPVGAEILGKRNAMDSALTDR